MLHSHVHLGGLITSWTIDREFRNHSSDLQGARTKSPPRGQRRYILRWGEQETRYVAKSSLSRLSGIIVIADESKYSDIYSREVQARYVAPCTATSPSAFRIVLGSFSTSRTRFRISSFFSPGSLAICERVLYLDQTFSSVSQTTHSTLSSPMGRENEGSVSVKVPFRDCRGVVYCWSSKTFRQARCLNRGWPSSIPATMSFNSCSHFVAVFHACAPLSRVVSECLVQGTSTTYSPLCSKSCQKQLLVV